MMKKFKKINLINSNLGYNFLSISSLDEGVEDTGTSKDISLAFTLKNHKKQDTTHYNEHKKRIRQRRRKRNKQEII